ncbi:hypothetical protein MTR_5g464420 [Medicago truncatula]|uniref:Uncharacterized protein n=1 Tax=Medicago truncatula TaxID=3880 RepID=A0A072UEI3_MEDTR|nr:hypothetical protein MTR_5g464420 [Medicago truncatula]
MSVREMEERGWSVDGGALVWRRRFLAWEEESVAECVALLSDIVLQDTIIDRWRWVLDPIKGYSVKGIYQYLTSSDSSVDQNCQEKIICFAEGFFIRWTTVVLEVVVVGDGASDKFASDEFASDDLASDDVISSGALCLQERFIFRSSFLQTL